MGPEEDFGEMPGLNDLPCFEENGLWYCYEVSPSTEVRLEFEENIECFLDEESLDKYEEKGNCFTSVKFMEDVTINSTLREIHSPQEYKRVKREKEFKKNDNITAIVSPEQIDYNRCGEPELNDTLLDLTEIYKVDCNYTNREYSANITYYGEGILIHEMAPPKEESFRIPLSSLPILILIILVIGTGVWVFYPKIKDHMK